MARTEPTIANYEAQSADEITQRLRKLSQADLAKLEAYERQGQARRTVLERIAALRGEPPWPGYDDMEVEEVNAALRERDSAAASRVLDYERRHKDRTTIVEYAEGRREGDGPRARTSGRARGRTSGSRSSKGSASSRRAGAASRRRSTGASGARQGGAAKASSSSRTRSSGQRSGGRRVREAGSAGVKQQAKRVTKGARNAAGAAADEGRDALGEGRDALGTAARKAKGPVLTGAVALAALGGGLAVGKGANIRLRRRKRVLGVPIPRRTAVGKAAKRAGHALDSLDELRGAPRLRWPRVAGRTARAVASRLPPDAQ